MTGLYEARAFRNISKVQQSVFNERNGAYDHIQPGQLALGPHYRGIDKNSGFQETLEHLVYHEIVPLVREETNIDLLKRLLVAEAKTKKREAVAKTMTYRIKALSKEVAKNAAVGNS